MFYWKSKFIILCIQIILQITKYILHLLLIITTLLLKNYITVLLISFCNVLTSKEDPSSSVSQCWTCACMVAGYNPGIWKTISEYFPLFLLGMLFLQLSKLEHCLFISSAGKFHGKVSTSTYELC